jgi:enoyl-CoA hydratase/3-hydroxyacyl-CoA dehydrogenase
VPLENIKNVVVLGSGVMGGGIAQVAAANGHNVWLLDISEDLLKAARERIRWSIEKFVEKGKLTRDDADQAFDRIKTTINLKEAVENADFVIEVAPEDISLKTKIFGEVDRHAPPNAIIASNTSGLSITMLSESTERPDKVLGMHWFNPPQIMRGVEVIRGKHTSNDTLQATIDLCRKYGKEPFLCRKDVWMFLANRVYRGMSFEPLLMLLRGEAGFLEIDSAVRYKLGLPMGPFELADLTGAADIMVETSKTIDKVLKKYPEWEPRPILLKTLKYLVGNFWNERRSKGLVGIKSGRGFYEYPGPGKYKRPDIPKEAGEGIDEASIIASIVNTGAWALNDGVGTKEEIDKAMKLSFGWPKGVFELADEVGIDRIVESLRDKKNRSPEGYRDFYEIDPLLAHLVDIGHTGIKSGKGFYDY